MEQSELYTPPAQEFIVPSNPADSELVIDKRFNGLPVRKASDFNSRGTCWLIYGPGGGGKTTVAATAADTALGSPVVVLDAEGGTESLAHRSDIDVIDIFEWEQIRQFCQGLAVEGPQWRTVVIDNLSELQAINVRHILKGHESDMPTQPEWGRSTVQMLQMIRFFRDYSRHWPINVIFTAWSTRMIDEDTKMTKYGVNFTPALRDRVPGVIPLVGYLTVENNAPHYTRVLHMSPSGRTDSKFRRAQAGQSMAIPYDIPNPSMVSLLGVMRGGEPWSKFEQLHTMPTKPPGAQSGATPAQAAQPAKANAAQTPSATIIEGEATNPRPLSTEELLGQKETVDIPA